MTSPGPDPRRNPYPPSHTSIIHKSISNPAMSNPGHSRRLSERFSPGALYLDHTNPQPSERVEYFIPNPNPNPTPKTIMTCRSSNLATNLLNLHPRNDRTKGSFGALEDLKTQNFAITTKAQHLINPNPNPNPTIQGQKKARQSHTDRPQQRDPLKSRVFGQTSYLHSPKKTFVVKGEPENGSITVLPKKVIKEKVLFCEDGSNVIFGSETKQPKVKQENSTKTAVNAGMKPPDENLAKLGEKVILLGMENERLVHKVLGLEKDLEGMQEGEKAVQEWREKFETCDRQKEQNALEIKKYQKGRVDFQEKVDFLEKSLRNLTSENQNLISHQRSSEKLVGNKNSELENLVESLNTQLSAKSDRIKSLERSKIDFDGKIRITTLENASLLTRNKNFELELGTMRDSMVKKSKLEEIDQKLTLQSHESQRQEQKISGLNNEIRMLATENER